MDCVGSWGACAGPPLAQFKTYTWTTSPLNGGSAATCGYPNGQTDSTGCNSCPTIGNYTHNVAGACWDFTQSANGNFCQGEKAPECGSLTWGLSYQVGNTHLGCSGPYSCPPTFGSCNPADHANSAQKLKVNCGCDSFPSNGGEWFTGVYTCN